MSLALRLVCVVALAVVGTYAAGVPACGTTDQLTCTTTAGFQITDVICLQGNPATCGVVICNLTRWIAMNNCLNAIPCSLGQTEASCRSTFQVCPASFITTLCTVPPTVGVISGDTPTTAAATPAPPVAQKYSGVLRLTGDWSTILASQTALVQVGIALVTDLSTLLGQTVTITSASAGSLIVSWETVNVVSNATTFNTRVATATSSTTWLTNTQSAFVAQGGSGTVSATSMTSNAGTPGSTVTHTTLIAGLLAAIIAAVALL